MNGRSGPVLSGAAALAQQFDVAFTRPTATEERDDEQLLAVQVAGDPYAVRVSQIAGLFADKATTRLPGAPRRQLGVTGFRGTVVPVYDLRALLGYPRGEPRWMVLAASDPPVALAFDRFEAHRPVPRAAITSTTAAGAAGAQGLTTAVASIEGVAHPIVDVTAVVALITGTRNEGRT